ncbi:MAG: ABC transporter permease [Planctomycetales bacterium]|nr:ABC transporter permease [Planctomycetales bacterium]
MRGRFIVSKLLGSLSTLAFVVVLNFFLFRVVTDDPIGKLYRGRNLTAEQIDAKRREFHLDGSRLEQFVAYVRQTLRGNLGDSILSGRPVWTEIKDALWPTVMLVGLSTLLSMLIGVGLGIHAGWRRRSGSCRHPVADRAENRPTSANAQAQGITAGRTSMTANQRQLVGKVQTRTQPAAQPRSTEGARRTQPPKSHSGRLAGEADAASILVTTTPRRASARRVNRSRKLQIQISSDGFGIRTSTKPRFWHSKKAARFYMRRRAGVKEIGEVFSDFFTPAVGALISTAVRTA